MKKNRLILLAAFASLLTGCDFFSSFTKTNVDISNVDDTNIEHIDGETENGENTGGNTHVDDGGNTHVDDGGNTGTQTDGEYHPTNTPFPLSEWTNFSWHNGHKPDYDPNWSYYYGDSYSPNGQLWENPNENVDYSGVEFNKNCFIVSPLFNSWEKIEIRLYFWFSAHQSDKYKAINGEPQFKIELYDNSDKLLSKVNIEIAKSDVPTNNAVKEIKTYVYEPTCTYFILRWNNYVPNSQGGYSAILTEAGLKGWPYGK